MKRFVTMLVFISLTLATFVGYAYDPYYVKQQTYKKYVSILKEEQQKVNDKYLAYYLCEPDLNAGLEKIPTLFVIVVDHVNQTMHTTAYGVIFNEDDRVPELKSCEIPMLYSNFKIRRDHSSFVILQETQNGWIWGRFQGLGSCDYKKLGSYKEDPYDNMIPLRPFDCSDLEPLKYVFSLP